MSDQIFRLPSDKSSKPRHEELLFNPLHWIVGGCYASQEMVGHSTIENHLKSPPKGV